ncbi:lipoyl synthase [Clostridium pasteurianum DSM 525 = ATCC 6013]|uniref:Lipoyl synthase n=1 Tax=Clostridium pasteurianum DSM 525 = ATCC 6013 TaxID=1262449 RepID=A0A0H3J802_CLOPA|nr:lipoyl synthase [Clostridium pasteurianum]AJA48033.1 lipoyl synthase [Clostridium pasteurianum DSM 525 = ATCC 6013]AJA52021.1 lipoyl synthase [Clostridium pasteurianum DSM 525 = ATCC 6013]AOZ75315.1 lipoyl synthase [Clostridium pasteurianum DSM 525 = ATCC 6013]AOZ79110.1 lipoyl synthase [Clostridium pasteurianum]ELP59935.1 lipoyl synthase [Clostridium pasteurianum DSM 525 = ATCC 6013]
MSERPEWLKVKAPEMQVLEEMESMLKKLSLHTVCESANCPNIGKCFKNKTATFMVMGDVCTRNCRFCAVRKGLPRDLDSEEPVNVAIASKKLGLKHVVITSVTRDDLGDGGADHFVKIVNALRKLNPNSTIELLIPDLKGNWQALRKIVEAKPDIINHNIETIPRLYKKVRPKAVYERSIELLNQCKRMDERIYTKSGIMLGIGEKQEEVEKVMDDLISVKCDVLTLGQYLSPSQKHVPVVEYVSIEKFNDYKYTASNKGFKFVASGPFVRSSYKAFEGMETLKNFNRQSY